MKEIGKDKLLHFIAGLLICVVMGSIGGLFTADEPAMAYGFGVGCTLIAGMAKEIHDGEEADPKDFVATLAGGIVGVLLLFLAQTL